ncbi:MAG: ATP-binding protein, partial [Gammaproteobacteria bacterium]|nr:ATP-binding protein [Gammaproteobacteria bacterium]
DFSKIEAGKLELESVDFDLYELLENTVSVFSEPAHKKGLHINCSIDPAAAVLVLGDPTRLQQILNNLVGNAIKFTEQGGVIIHLAQIERDAGKVLYRFSVEDTGVGIEPEAISKIFDSFSQADGSTTRVFGGSGLGLAIVKEIVQLMGGEIGLESTLGKGSCFWFNIPMPLLGNSSAADYYGRFIRDNYIALVVDPQTVSSSAVISCLLNLGVKAETVVDMEQANSKMQTLFNQGRSCHFVIIASELQDKAGQLDIPASASGETETVVIQLQQVDKGGISLVDKNSIQHFLPEPVFLAPLVELIEQSKGIFKPDAHQKSLSETPFHEQRILIVEDNLLNQAVAKEMLELLGCHVTLANNGQEAVTMLDSTAFDLVLMDVQMPVMDGLEATMLIRKKPGAVASTPIIAVTANAMIDDRKACLAAGMDDFMSKPYTYSQIQSILEQWLPAWGSNNKIKG